MEIEKSMQATQALIYVGSTVAVDGSKAQFDKSATWNFHSGKNTTATITITNSAGQTAYTGSYALNRAIPASSGTARAMTASSGRLVP